MTILLALSLTLLAGLATGIGSLIAFFTQKTNTKFLSVALGFSAGVMIYVSFVEILFKARESLAVDLGGEKGDWFTVLFFFAGMFLVAVIDKFIPSLQNPHEIKGVEELKGIEAEGEQRGLLRTGLLTAMAVGLHNFPEGLATFMAALKDASLGIPIALAVALHNIPEGIAVAVPIYYATGDKKKAFLYSFLSGLAEPAGALAGFLILSSFLGDGLFGAVFAAVAGIMVFISLDELLPAAEKYGEHHLAIYGLISGMILMALSLLLL